jgi:hypothetical protein
LKSSFDFICDVLSDGRRILRKKTFLNSLGRSNTGSKESEREESSNLPIFLIAKNLTPYLQPEITLKGAPIAYRGVDGRKLIGYEASLLPWISHMTYGKIYLTSMDLVKKSKREANYEYLRNGYSCMVSRANQFAQER